MARARILVDKAARATPAALPAHGGLGCLTSPCPFSRRPRVTLRHAGAAVRRGDRRRAHLPAARDRRRRITATSADDRPADVRGRAPHGVAARALRVRARERQPPVRVVVPALHPFYTQWEQSLAAFRAPRRGAGALPSLGGEAERLRGRDRGAWDSYRRLTELEGRHPPHPGGAAAPDAERLGEAAQEGRARGREEGDRDRPLRDPDRRLHVDGAHAQRDRAAPALSDDAHRRRAGGDARGRRGDGGAREGARSGLLRPHRPGSARRDRDRRDAPAALRAGRDAGPPGSMPASEAGCPCSSTTWDGRSRRPPTLFARCSAPRPTRSPTTTRSSGCSTEPEPLPARDAAAVGAFPLARACTTRATRS